MSYRYKYQKYRSKCNHQVGAAGTDAKYAAQLSGYLKQLETTQLTIPFIEELQHFFQESTQKSYDVERMHMLEDQLAKTFIQNIVNGSFDNVDQIQSLARLIYAINAVDYYKWYS